MDNVIDVRFCSKVTMGDIRRTLERVAQVDGFTKESLVIETHDAAENTAKVRLVATERTGRAPIRERILLLLRERLTVVTAE